MTTVVRFEIRWTKTTGRKMTARFDTHDEALVWLSRAFQNGRVFTLVKVTVTEEIIPLV